MIRVIPDGATQLKEGLYVVESVIPGGIKKWELYSADGWCFYDLEQPENYVNGVVGGELVPDNQRSYAQYMIMRKDEAYVTNNIVSVPIQEGFEIV